MRLLTLNYSLIYENRKKIGEYGVKKANLRPDKIPCKTTCKKYKEMIHYYKLGYKLCYR